MKLLTEDLFSESTWNRFGLSRGALLKTGALGGAATGGALDMVTVGHTLLLGSAIGVVIGGGLAWFAGDKLAAMKVLKVPMGGKQLVCGPMHNDNFPFVVLGRARLHHCMVAGRPHARRDALTVAGESDLPLSDAARKSLAAAFQALRKDNDVAALTQNLSGSVRDLLIADSAEA